MKREKKIFSSFWPGIRQWGRGGGGGGGGGGGEKTDFRERESNFSLDFPAFGPWFLSKQDEKLVYAARATRGHRFCAVSTNFER